MVKFHGLIFLKRFQSGVILTTVCVLDGFSRQRMILTGRFHLVQRLRRLQVQVTIKEGQVVSLFVYLL